MSIDPNTFLGLVSSALLGVLIFMVKNSRVETKGIGDKLDSHILEITKAMAQKVDIGGCSNSQEKCKAMQQQLIADPLHAAIVEMRVAFKESKTHQRRTTDEIWAAIRSHMHTALRDSPNDSVIIPNRIIEEVRR
jgi:hypothetical protein